MPLIQSQVGALMQFRREINQISTWPWKPQTLRSFITAISLPIVIWLIQQYLGQIIGA
jgi:preprotein translocase subunit SecE